MTFVYETFGQQFGELLMAGYGSEPSGRHRKLYFTDLEAGVGTGWEIELAARRVPCRDEPLVLAALFKLLLSRPSLSHHLELEMSELLAELKWLDTMSTRRKVETTIRGYVRLFYSKQADMRSRRHTSETVGGGYYHLLTAYVREDRLGAAGTCATTLSGIYFDAGLIDGLKRGRVNFAGIDFGPFKDSDEASSC